MLHFYISKCHLSRNNLLALIGRSNYLLCPDMSGYNQLYPVGTLLTVIASPLLYCSVVLFMFATIVVEFLIERFCFTRFLF